AEKVSPCCVEVSRFMEDINITDFRLQKQNLPCVKAVIFQTERGQFCIYPHQPWVRRKIKEL
ncbi:C-C motif chemokine 24-like, partial [Clarias magur]